MPRSVEHESAAASVRPVRPEPAPDRIFDRFVRGREHPRGVVWFGATSFWGHLRHLASAAIAAENIDSRDWMEPDDPASLTTRVVEVVGGDARQKTVTEGLGRDLYLDFVADTGDDVSVSRAVARLLFAEYELPDPDSPGEFLTVPRGDVLVFGGDTAYPVATAREILQRIVIPWNQILTALPEDGRQRVLLGIPGNHDWYDGLDGFGRMFRRRAPGGDGPPEIPSLSPTMVHQYAEWARRFLRGEAIEKPAALELHGYVPVQDASYFALRLAPRVDLLAADRQLTTVERRQQRFLAGEYRSRRDTATLLLLPDPVFLFGEPSKTGTEVLERLGLDFADRETFALSGDLHHYERFERGRLLHVIAGGGGAFLHPVRVAPGGVAPIAVWPSREQSRRLLRQVPWKVALGRSGFLPHLALLALYGPAFIVGWATPSTGPWTAVVALLNLLVLAIAFGLIGGAVRRLAVLRPAIAAGLIGAAIPVGADAASRATFAWLGESTPSFVILAGTLLLTIFAGSYLFGAFLVFLTLRGHEHMQALTALDHPGFKHFVRLRIRADGRGIDGWCVGLVDPLARDARPVLVDRFTWRPFG